MQAYLSPDLRRTSDGTEYTWPACPLMLGASVQFVSE